MMKISEITYPLKSITDLDNLYVVVSGSLSWPEIYDKDNQAYMEQPDIKIYRFSEGLKEFCLNNDINSGISAGLYASETIKKDAESIISYMKSIGCNHKSIQSFKTSLNPKLKGYECK